MLAFTILTMHPQFVASHRTYHGVMRSTSNSHKRKEGSCSDSSLSPSIRIPNSKFNYVWSPVTCSFPTQNLVRSKQKKISDSKSKTNHQTFDMMKSKVNNVAYGSAKARITRSNKVNTYRRRQFPSFLSKSIWIVLLFLRHGAYT